MSNQEPAVVRSEWTDQDLDAALEHLRTAAGPVTATERFADARTVLMEAAAARSTSRPSTPAVASRRAAHERWWRRPILIAAAVAVLVAGGLIIPTLHWGGQPVNTAAAAELSEAADAAARVAAAGSDVIPAGGYRYVTIDAWYASMSTDLTYLQQSRQQIWVPADWEDTWMERRSTTGARKWIHGSEPEAVAMGLPADNVASTEPDLTGACAAYFTNLCTAEGSWQTPTQAWIDGLPTNSDDMYDRLYDDSQGHGQSQESEMLVQATDALRTGLLPAAVRATLYRAMANIDGVEITDAAANLDGKVGIGFSVESPALRDETIIDPNSGDFIGTRITTLVEDPVIHLPAGTVISFTAVTTTVVDALGATGP